MKTKKGSDVRIISGYHPFWFGMKDRYILSTDINIFKIGFIFSHDCQARLHSSPFHPEGTNSTSAPFSTDGYLREIVIGKCLTGLRAKGVHWTGRRDDDLIGVPVRGERICVLRTVPTYADHSSFLGWSCLRLACIITSISQTMICKIAHTTS